MDVAERTRLLLAPVGTPGLAELGLDDPEYSDLAKLGPAARTEALERQRAHAMTLLATRGLPADVVAALAAALGGGREHE